MRAGDSADHSKDLQVKAADFGLLIQSSFRIE